MATNVTSIFRAYREHARHLRNTAFMAAGLEEWDIIDDFTAVNDALFEALVLRRLPEGSLEAAREWRRKVCFFIEPSGGGMKVIASRDKGRTGGCWRSSVDLLKGSATIAFCDFFDFSQTGFVSFQYYLGFVVDCDEKIQLKEHFVLIEPEGSEILIDATEIPMPSAYPPPPDL